SAGQCGPCVLGLPALASAAAELTWGSRRQRAVVDRLEAIGAQVVGRGACHHPDGVARMVRSALRAFGPHVEDHLRFGPCRAAAAPPALSPARAMQRVPGSA
ncbi:MAG TPA: NADH-ubiquinone oxidoreductase-F iron-sulfur binding region domain-containing protein, partial [Acidimicrobiales bacterium]|nr:NADH-ubiquinone oxidoreductase-F iron-sulfur binding region domain-containing protein [Acidimicrobiales bacterium]